MRGNTNIKPPTTGDTPATALFERRNTRPTHRLAQLRIRADQDDAIAKLMYLTRMNRSEIIRNALDIGLTQVAANHGYSNDPDLQLHQ